LHRQFAPTSFAFLLELLLFHFFTKVAEPAEPAEPQDFSDSVGNPLGL
jgi:hypothetical protein